MSLMLLSAVLVSASDTQMPEHGSSYAFVTYVDARESADLFGGFWATTKDSDVVGNIYAFEQLLLFRDKDAVLGLNSGYCIRTDPAGATNNDAPNLLDDPNDNFKQCTWTVTFGSNGTFTAGNTLQLMARLADVKSSRAAIVGGTGAFQGAFGWATYENEPEMSGGAFIRQAFNFTIDIEIFSGATNSPPTAIPETYSPGSSVVKRETVVRVSNVTVPEIQRGMVAYQARLREVTGAVSASCGKICGFRKGFRMSEYVLDECYGCDTVMERKGAALHHDDTYVYDIHVAIETQHTQTVVETIITNNFRYLVEAVSPYVTLASTHPHDDSDDDMPAEEIFAICLVAVVVVGVIVAFLVLGKKKQPEPTNEPVEEEEEEPVKEDVEQ